jgi:YD repeat-containing protein
LTPFLDDKNGNRFVKTNTQADEEYIYGGASNRLLARETLVPGAVPPAAVPERELVYNDAGRLKTLFEAGVLIATYTYNAYGLRTRKVTGAGITLYHYDLSGRLIAETEADGMPIRDYIWQGNTPIVQIDVEGGIDTVTYLHSDHLLTARVGTDELGQVVWRWQ